jgi:hypothetical protein
LQSSEVSASDQKLEAFCILPSEYSEPQVVLTQSHSLEGGDMREFRVGSCGHLLIQQGDSALVGQGLRQTASRILLAFQGAAHGSQYSVNVLLEELLDCYL